MPRQWRAPACVERERRPEGRTPRRMQTGRRRVGEGLHHSERILSAPSKRFLNPA